MRLAVALAALLVAAVPASGAGAGSGSRVVYAYLADNTLVRTDTTLRSWTRVRIGRSPKTIVSIGQLLARSRDGRRLWVLDRATPALVELTRDLRRTRTISMPPRWQPRALAIGPRTGRLYVAYNLAFPVRGRHDPPRSARLAIYEPGGRLLHDVLLRPHGGRSWLVWWLAVSSDERRAYVSYHGSDTTGLDTLTLAASGVERCAWSASGFTGCWSYPHGMVATLGAEVVTATGAPVVNVYDTNGDLARELDTGLEGNHLMGFALDPAGQRLAAVGSCGYVSGFAAVDVSSGERLLLTHRRAVCGESIAFAGSNDVIVGKTTLPVPDPEREGALLVVDPMTGAVLHTRRTRSEPIAVASYG